MENWIIERIQLDEMPYDHWFNGELCHATGDAVLDENGDWWNEYENSDGELFYGR